MTQEENERQNMIRVVVCRPGERAEVTEIEDNLRSMQTVVGGLIQEYFPFHSEDDPRYDDLALIVNEEGKLMRMPPSRAVFDEDGKQILYYEQEEKDGLIKSKNFAALIWGLFLVWCK